MSIRPLVLSLALASSSALALPGDTDTAFGSQGWAGPGTAYPAQVTGIHVGANDQRIYLVGEKMPPDGQSQSPLGCFVARLTATGQLDAAWGNGGRVEFLLQAGGGSLNSCRASLLLPDGSLVVGARMPRAGIGHEAAFVRILANGALDAGFAPGGVYLPEPLPLNANEHAPEPLHLTRLPSGEVLATGTISNIYGAVAWTFAAEGPAQPSSFATRRIANAGGGVTVRTGDRVDVVGLIGGHLTRYESNLQDGDARGALFAASRAAATGSLLQPDLAVLVAATAWNDGVNPMLEAVPAGRWSAAGTPDAGFVGGPGAQAGQSLIDLLQRGYVATPTSDGRSAMALLPTGRSVQVGTVRDRHGTARHGLVAARRSNGAAETTFAIGGSRVLQAPGSADTRLEAVAVDGAGRILAAGHTRGTLSRRGVVVRLQADNSSPHWGTRPAPLAIAPRNDAPRNAWVVSDAATVSGLDAGLHVPVLVEGGQYRINDGGWLSGPGWVRNGDRIALRHLTPGAGNAVTETSASVGGLYDPRNAMRVVGQRETLLFRSSTTGSLPGIRCSNNGLCNSNAPIPDNAPLAPVTSTIQVFESCNFVTAIRVGLDITHTYVGDLNIFLRPPGRPAIPLIQRPRGTGMPGAGNCSQDDILATLELGDLPNAQAMCGQLGPGLRALDGSLRPGAGFPGIIGGAGQGAWTLTVSDNAAQDTGVLRDWSLDIRCQATPPALADLRLALTAPANLVAGDPRFWTLAVSNDGPARAPQARFTGQLGRHPVTAQPLFNPHAWRCVAPAGSSCTLPAGCAGPWCSMEHFQPSLDLAAGATATIELLATPDPFLDQGQEVAFDAGTWIPLAIGGVIDPDDSNDRIGYRRDVVVSRNLGLEAGTATRIGNEVDVAFELVNLGPSAELGGSHVDIQFPAGYLLGSDAECTQGGLPCPGTLEKLADNPTRYRLRGYVVGPGAAPLMVRVRAVFSGLTPPPAPVSVAIGQVVNDHDPSNNTLSLVPDSGPVDRIFANGFQ